MNSRIKELKHQAFLWCDENIPEQYSHETGYGDAWEDKFGELIVRECANIDFRHKVGMTTDQEFETGCVILEHFGVE